MKIQDSLIVDELKMDSSLGIAHLVGNYQDRLYYWGQRQFNTLNDYDLLEIIDDTFMRVIEKIDLFQLKSEKGFKNWVFTIFSRMCIDHLIKEARIAEHIQIQSLDNNPSGTHNQILSGVQLELDRKIFHDYCSPKPEEHPLALKVREFSDDLDEKNQIILHACADGYPHKEIAKWVGIPSAHVKVYYSRLKKRLEKYLIETKGA
ncbi:MAG: sigma-70 family RNA polymerase sigma factor [Deltaproteobacteria bacterium]|nr:sigma-70 family RNA polymerase sigma factor [Deltaproteobacteria bacterium]